MSPRWPKKSEIVVAPPEDADIGVVQAAPSAVEESVPEKPVAPSVEQLVADEEEVVKLRLEVAKLKTELAVKEDKTLDEMLKDPSFGTTLYLGFIKSTSPNPLNPNLPIRIAASLSAFPDAVNPRTGDLLAPDIGFDNRKEADKYRDSDIEVQFKGDLMPIKKAIKALQQEYYDRRKQGDLDFLSKPKVS